MPDSPTIACPGCGKTYKWKPQLAGRKTQCTGCGRKLRLPDDADGPVELLEGPPAKADHSNDSRGAYELDIPDDADPHVNPAAGRQGGSKPAPPPSAAHAASDRCPACNSKLKPGAVICINCGYNVAEGKKIKTAVTQDAAGDDADDAPAASTPNLGAYAKAAQRTLLDSDALAADEAQAQQRKDVTIPLVLLAIGLVGIAVNALVLHRFVFAAEAQRNFQREVQYAQAMGMTPPTGPATMSLLDMAIPLIVNAAAIVIQTPMLLLAMFLVARMFGTSFGRMGTALLKLLALAVFVNMATSVAQSLFAIGMGGMGGMGLYMSLGVNFLVFFPLAMWLYELETMEATTMWFLAFVLPWLLLMLGGALILSMIL